MDLGAPAAVLTRAQESGQARPDITRADIVDLIWSNGRIIDAQLHDAVIHLSEAR